MSYILDALKKSESERLRRDAPGFADLPAHSRAARTPRWIWLLGALLLVNAVVLASLLLRPTAPPPAESGVGATPASAPAAAPEAGIRPAGPPAVAATPAERPTPDAAASAPAVAAAPPGTADRAPAGGPAPRPVTPKPTVEPASAAAAGTPTLMQLRADGTLSLPELHLDIHVYSSEPAERFVFVNMNKYRERDRLAEGPLVREIGPDGVILEYRDAVFLLPRE